MEQKIRDFLHTKMQRVAADIEVLFRNSLRITTRVIEEEALPAGASKIGGTPDLPPGVSWPMWKDVPLAFIAQVNLRDASGLDTENLLPERGLLSFFYAAHEEPWGFDPTDRGSSVVLYFEDVEGGLARAVPPADLLEDSVFKACALEWSSEATIPERGSHYVDVLNLRSGIRNKEKERYDELTWMIVDSHSGPVHRMLGYSDPIQGSMEMECQLVTNGIYCGDAKGYESKEAQVLAHAAGDWILLFQVDSDDDANMMWGDSGRLYYWIRRQDLANCDFTKTWVVLQCY